MNMFVLDMTPEGCAINSSDTHTCGMPKECAQMLCTAHRMRDGYKSVEKNKLKHKLVRWRMKDREMDELLYKSNHLNHPNSVWCRASIENYNWLYQLFRELSLEYTYRYEKEHDSWRRLGNVLSEPPRSLQERGFTIPPMSMPDCCKSSQGGLKGVVESYRSFYHYKYEVEGKKMKWNKNRPAPDWWNPVGLATL